MRVSSHVHVSLKIMEKLLSEVNGQRVQLLADSYLEMIHEMLQCNNLTFQILAANSVSPHGRPRSDSFLSLLVCGIH